MAATLRTVTVDLNEDLVERAVARSGHGAAQEASEVVEEALAVYLGIKALDQAPGESELSDEDASRLAYDELRLLRRERGEAR
jgi:anti-sigma factor RsiW